jgi:hypothetical protein
MQFSESKSRFLDGVRDALRRYDSQLKDINHKVRMKSGRMRDVTNIMSDLVKP